MQNFIIIALFLVALAYMGFRAYCAVSRKNAGCGKGCGCEADARPARTV